jgi:hypothetical protein
MRTSAPRQTPRTPAASVLLAAVALLLQLAGPLYHLSLPSHVLGPEAQKIGPHTHLTSPFEGPGCPICKNLAQPGPLSLSRESSDLVLPDLAEWGAEHRDGRTTRPGCLDTVSRGPPPLS